jgi:hypothetical protein
MEDRQLSNNFNLSEFSFVEPDPRLLNILQYIRDYTARPINITDSWRDVPKLIQIYEKLEEEKKIKTIGNGLGDEELINIIPWKSRHLPTFGNPYLRAVDIQSKRANGAFYTGEELKDIIMDYVKSKEYLLDISLLGYTESQRYVGIGVGKQYLHLDVDRTRHTMWGYGY